jgi:guanylate kinase
LTRRLEPYNYHESPLLIVISGPSGVGKDSVVNHLKQAGYPFHFVITATSRPPRPGETHGVDYFFITKPEFEAMIANDELIEHALVYGDYKGVPKKQVREALASGQDVMMRVDVQGAATMRRLAPEAVLIYLSAESEEALTNRLRSRQTDSAEQLQRRVAAARHELEQLDLFDYVVVNPEGQLEETCQKIMAIITTEKCRVQQREINL